MLPEIKEGMSRSEVEMAIGKPTRLYGYPGADSQGYVYEHFDGSKSLMITFADGRVVLKRIKHYRK